MRAWSLVLEGLECQGGQLGFNSESHREILRIFDQQGSRSAIIRSVLSEEKAVGRMGCGRGDLRAGLCDDPGKK